MKPGHLEIIREFVKCVEEIAEKKMLETGKLEGAHYAAMKQLLKELEEQNRDKNN
jgi:hypothetical protein